MSRGVEALLVLDALWLAGIALVMLILRRELAIMSERAQASGRTVPDGLEVGEPVPKSCEPERNRILLFFQEHCDSCHEIASGLDEVVRHDLLDVVIIPVSEDGRDITLEGLLPSFVSRQVGTEAKRTAGEFRVHSSPLAIAVSGGLTVAKTYVGDTAVLGAIIDQLESENVDSRAS